MNRGQPKLLALPCGLYCGICIDLANGECHGCGCGCGKCAGPTIKKSTRTPRSFSRGRCYRRHTAPAMTFPIPRLKGPVHRFSR